MGQQGRQTVNQIDHVMEAIECFRSWQFLALLGPARMRYQAPGRS